jgi:hypothetical protein
VFISQISRFVNVLKNGSVRSDEMVNKAIAAGARYFSVIHMGLAQTSWPSVCSPRT